MEQKEKIKILFLCTGNSCRSQMAEGIANALRGDEFIAFSAGTRPSKVSERAIEVMAEAGVDISGHHSKSIDDVSGVEFDYVITLCDNAKESCPIFPGKAKIIHHGFSDPAEATGDEEQIRNEFRRVRDKIKEYIGTLTF